ncbi:hypothetical protein GQ457_16G013680 [Hibiscus cannabinus]
MEEYWYKEQQKCRNSISVPWCRIVLILVFSFCLCTYVDISTALPNKPLHIFIIINFIVFALFVLSSRKQFPDDVRSQRNRNGISDDVDSPPSLDEDEHCGGLEEMNIVDKHVILEENVVGGIVVVDSDNSGECLERNLHRGRRLEGRMSKELVITMMAGRLMDDMSNEELRFAIEL